MSSVKISRRFFRAVDDALSQHPPDVADAFVDKMVFQHGSQMREDDAIEDQGQNPIM